MDSNLQPGVHNISGTDLFENPVGNTRTYLRSLLQQDILRLLSKAAEDALSKSIPFHVILSTATTGGKQHTHHEDYS